MSVGKCLREFLTEHRFRKHKKYVHDDDQMEFEREHSQTPEEIEHAKKCFDRAMSVTTKKIYKPRVWTILTNYMYEL